MTRWQRVNDNAGVIVLCIPLVPIILLVSPILLAAWIWTHVEDWYDAQ